MKAQLHARHALAPALIEQMHSLLNLHFVGVTYEQFIADLNQKNWAILLTHDDGRLCGFTTLDYQHSEFNGQPESVIYSGDTIMDPTAWNSTVLARAWINAAYQLHENHGQGPLWWLLITSGFRTYRLLPVFWCTFFPSHNGHTPPEHRQRRDFLAQQRFGSRFNPDTGVVQLEHPQRLREHLNGIPQTRLSNPHVTFFETLNPNHHEGNELACLAQLDEINLTKAGKRIVDSIRRQPILEPS